MAEVYDTYENVSLEDFHEKIRPRNRPALLKGLCKDWPAVKKSQESKQALAEYIKDLAADRDYWYGQTLDANEDCFHYSSDMRGFNFQKIQCRLPNYIQTLVNEINNETQHSKALQGMLVQEFLPRFTQENPNPLLGPNNMALMWISNKSNVATHQDPYENIACVVAGTRRFTLFPPDQLPNLYIGPLHFTPAGNPISMVHLTKPDYEKYPRFAEAMRHAIAIDVHEGDAVYVPYHWFHHVASLEGLNILVNYWWSSARRDIGSPWDALMLSMLSIGNLPKEQRDSWRETFNNYVFYDEHPFSHIPPVAKNPVLEPAQEDIRNIKAFIIESIKKR